MSEPTPTAHWTTIYAQRQLHGLELERDALLVQVRSLVEERDALRSENDRLDAALEDAHIPQACGHPRACIASDEEGATWCEACVSVAAGHHA